MVANGQLDRPRLLIIDPDVVAVQHLAVLFDRPCWLYDVTENTADESAVSTLNDESEPKRRVKSRGRGGMSGGKRRSSKRISLASPRICACGRAGPTSACCIAIESLVQLHNIDLNHADVVICATALADASGLDALAYIRGMRPHVPVILTGDDASFAVEAIRGGALDFLVATTLQDLNMLPLAVEKSMIHQRIKQENDRLHTELKRSLAELAVTNHQLQAVIRQLEAMARTDELTGLSNRRWFNLMLQGSWAESTRNNLPLACLMIDLDGFKSVNDTMGHHQGDDLLRLAAKVIKANCREIDTPARYGGDEFCVLMGHTEPHEAAMVAERMLREFAHAMRERPHNQPQVGMSIGLSHINLSRPVNAEQLVSHADEAMYAAKSAGKQRVMIRDENGVHVPITRG